MNFDDDDDSVNDYPVKRKRKRAPQRPQILMTVAIIVTIIIVAMVAFGAGQIITISTLNTPTFVPTLQSSLSTYTPQMLYTLASTSTFTPVGVHSFPFSPFPDTPTATLLQSGCSSLSRTSFSYLDFNAIRDMCLLDSATFYTDPANPHAAILRLTSNDPCCQAGAVWYATKQTLQNGFETTFQFRISGGQGFANGADGFAFVIQDDPHGLSTIGNSGCDMGFDGIQHTVVVEFDTFQNPPYCETLNDPDGNHVAILTSNQETPVNPIHSATGTPQDWADPSFDMKDGKVHTVRITYFKGTMNVFVDNAANPLLTRIIDLTGLLPTGQAWIGFTSSTGTTTENHDLLNWSFATGTPQ